MQWSRATRLPCSRRCQVAEGLSVRPTARPVGRFSIVHDTSGPKVVLGVAWAAILLGAVAAGAGMVSAAVLVPVAALAGLQVATAWSTTEFTDRWAAAIAGGALAGSGAFGVAALGAAVLAVTLALFAYALVLPVPKRSNRLRTSELLMLSSMPAGLAAGSLLALVVELPQAFVSLVALVSAFEMGDFLVGSAENDRVGSQLAGVVAGLSALGLVATSLFLLLPYPFTTANLPVYAIVAALGAPFGQLCGSALMPAMSRQAPAQDVGVPKCSPALLRLDSYLLVGPLWLILL